MSKRSDMNGSETKGLRRRSALGKDSGEKQGEREPGRTWSLISTAEGCVLGPWKGSEMTDVSDFRDEVCGRDTKRDGERRRRGGGMGDELSLGR